MITQPPNPPPLLALTHTEEKLLMESNRAIVSSYIPKSTSTLYLQGWYFKKRAEVKTECRRLVLISQLPYAFEFIV